MKSGDRQSVIVFGEQAVVDQPLATRPTRRATEGAGRRARHEHLPGDPAGAGHAAAGPRQPHRHAHRRPPERGQRASPAPRPPRTRAPIIYYVAAPLTFTQEVVAESMVLPQEVKFGEPFQAKVVAWSHRRRRGRLSLFRNGEFLGSQVVRFSAGKNVFSYRQSLDQSGIHVYQAALEVDGDTIEEQQPRGRHRRGARPAPGAARRQGPEPRPVAGRRAALAEHRRDRWWSRRQIPTRPGRPAEVRRRQSCPTSRRSS